MLVLSLICIAAFIMYKKNLAAKDDGLIRVECRLSALPLVLQWLKIAPVK